MTGCDRNSSNMPVPQKRSQVLHFARMRCEWSPQERSKGERRIDDPNCAVKTGVDGNVKLPCMMSCDVRYQFQRRKYTQTFDYDKRNHVSTRCAHS